MPPYSDVEAGKKWVVRVLEELGHGAGYEWGTPWADIPPGRVRSRRTAEQLILTTATGRRKIMWISSEYLREAHNGGAERDAARDRIREMLSRALSALEQSHRSEPVA